MTMQYWCINWGSLLAWLMKPALSRLPNVDVEAARASCPQPRLQTTQSTSATQQPWSPTNKSLISHGRMDCTFILLTTSCCFVLGHIGIPRSRSRGQHQVNIWPASQTVTTGSRVCCDNNNAVVTNTASTLPPAHHSSALACPGPRETMPWITRPLASCKLQRRSVGTCLNHRL